MLRHVWRGFTMYGMAATGVQASPTDPAVPAPPPMGPTWHPATGSGPGVTPGAALPPIGPSACLPELTGPGFAVPRLAAPPPGHPERLVPDLPLNAVERGLWRQLR
ncbi:DUF6059 family protein [Actinoplanes sp. NPDC051859]|uniref:DUF6059 family protein n=1 Tax=Actinoplanes sp. NPDC051859 TaxID=3363909 RepID=UPI0037BAD14F